MNWASVRVPREYRALGVSAEEWLYEEVAEAFDDLTEPMTVWDPIFTGLPSDVVGRVARDLAAAGLLAVFDVEGGPAYGPLESRDDYLEPVMHVYRLYDGANRLLYVGCTSKSVDGRVNAHRKKPWGSLISRVAVERVIGWRAGWTREADVIEAENPIHNKLRTVRSA